MFQNFTLQFKLYMLFYGVWFDEKIYCCSFAFVSVAFIYIGRLLFESSDDSTNYEDTDKRISTLSEELNQSSIFIEQLFLLLNETNQSNHLYEMEIEILQISLELEKQKTILQSISHNTTISELQETISSTQTLLDEAYALISQYESIDISNNSRCKLHTFIIRNLQSLWKVYESSQLEWWIVG